MTSFPPDPLPYHHGWGSPDDDPICDLCGNLLSEHQEVSVEDTYGRDYIRLLCPEDPDDEGWEFRITQQQEIDMADPAYIRDLRGFNDDYNVGEQPDW